MKPFHTIWVLKKADKPFDMSVSKRFCMFCCVVLVLDLVGGNLD